MAENTLIAEVTSGDFEAEVLRVSRDIPVLVDFWAAWCQPCGMLAPVLEQLAGEYAGKIKLAKVNSDEEPELANRFGIRSLPTVKLFRNGQVIDEFSGVIPLAGLRDFVQPHLSRPSDNLLQAATDAVANHDFEQALSLLMEAKESDPQNSRIYPLLIETLLHAGKYEEAGQTIRSLPVNIQHDSEIVRLNAVLGFAERAELAAKSPDTLNETLKKEPDNLDARYQLSALNVVNGDYETAMNNLLEIIRRDRSYKDDAGRKALLDIFTILDNEGELVKKYRAKLASTLN